MNSQILKHVFIIGPGKDPDTGVNAFVTVMEMIHTFCKVQLNDCAIIGDGVQELGVTNGLPQLDGRIDYTTRIAIIAHGVVCENQPTCLQPMHAITIENPHLAQNFPFATGDLLYLLNQASGSHKLQVHLFSCYADRASKDAIKLKDGSVLITHGRPDPMNIGHVMNFLVRNYLYANTSSPFHYFAENIAYTSILPSQFTIVANKKTHHFTAAPKNLSTNPEDSLIDLSKDFSDFYYNQHKAYRHTSPYFLTKSLPAPEISEPQILDHLQGTMHVAISLQAPTLMLDVAAKQPYLFKQTVTRSLPHDTQNFTLFLDAIRMKDFRTADLCLKHGADINHLNSKGASALLQATIDLDVNTVEFLVLRGANLTLTAQDINPITHARKGWEVVQQLSAAQQTHPAISPYQKEITKIWNILYNANLDHQKLEATFKGIPASTKYWADIYLAQHPNDAYSNNKCDAGDTTLFSYIDSAGAIMLVCEDVHSNTIFGTCPSP